LSGLHIFTALHFSAARVYFSGNAELQFGMGLLFWERRTSVRHELCLFSLKTVKHANLKIGVPRVIFFVPSVFSV
ncbi:MAG: hypothetical protein WBK65_10495, partial [Thermotogota bacterium]